jgi:hypothetical protein
MRLAPLRPPFIAVTSHIFARIAAASVDDVQARYDLGTVLLRLRRDAAGERSRPAVRALAERLGVDPSALRRYARVAETIGAEELGWLVKLRSARGMPLSWSHLDLLSRVRDAPRRRVLAEAVVAEDLTVRALTIRLRRR